MRELREFSEKHALLEAKCLQLDFRGKIRGVPEPSEGCSKIVCYLQTIQEITDKGSSVPNKPDISSDTSFHSNFSFS